MNLFGYLSNHIIQEKSTQICSKIIKFVIFEILLILVIKLKLFTYFSIMSVQKYFKVIKWHTVYLMVAWLDLHL